MAVSIQTCSITEGSTTLMVPEQGEPTKYPAFFNPQGRFVRDVSVVCYKAFGDYVGKRDLTFADSLAGTGARGIRVANEATKYGSVFLNDISPTALNLAKKSAQMNAVEEKCRFSLNEVCSFLSSREQNDGERFDTVDVDPFGSPSQFIDCALRSVKNGGLLSVSATDSAVLCGVYPHVALRKYMGLPLRTDYSHEVGMRLLFGLLAMTAMRFELSVKPLFCHHDKHYFRTYSEVHVGNKYSRENESEMGFIQHCFRCGYRGTISQLDFYFASPTRSREKGNNRALMASCPNCEDSILKIAGPLWIGKIQSKEFVESCARLSDLSVFAAELDLPLYYDLSEIADVMGVPTPRITDVASDLNSIGRSASRTRLNPKALRTDATLSEIRKILEERSR